MIDSVIKSRGQFIEYHILPEHKMIQFVAFKNEEDFNGMLKLYQAKRISVDYDRLKAENDSNYGNLARISLATVFVLSNGLYAIDQFINSKANPYYVCESLSDFKLITKYLLVFRPELSWPFQVQCSIHEHFEIKNFLEQEMEHLKFVESMSDESYKMFLAADGQCVYISCTNSLKSFLDNDYGKRISQVLPQSFFGNKFENEDVIYWSLVIYESIENLKLHNVNLKNR